MNNIASRVVYDTSWRQHDVAGDWGAMILSMTAEAQKHPKAAGIYDMVPTLEALFCSVMSVVTADLSTSSGEKTTVMPLRMPRRWRYLRM